MNRARGACCIGLLCWVSGTALSSPVFAETLVYREQSREATLQRAERGDNAENPYELRRKRFKNAHLPSPDLLLMKPGTVRPAEEPPAEPKREPMQITIPNLKALDNAPRAIAQIPADAPIYTDDSPRQTVADFKPVAGGEMTDSVEYTRVLPAEVHQPGLVIRKSASAATPEQMAALAPSAGEETDNSTPLLALPSEAPPPPPAPPAVTPLVPAAPAATPTETAAQTIAPPPAVQETPAAVTVPAPQVEKEIKEVIKATEPVQTYNEAAGELPALTPKSTPASAAPSVSEPEAALSRESKAILKNLPSNIDAPRPMPEGPFNIDRAKDTESMFKSDAPPADAIPAETSVSHEATGIKIEIKNRSANLDYELEKAYEALLSGQPTMAIEIYKNVLENDPNNQGALFGLATTYHRSGQIDAARGYYKKLLSIHPKHRDGLNNFLVLLADEAPEAALKQMEALAARNPDFSPIPAQMAVIYQRLGNIDKATEFMFKAVNMAPENLVYRYNLAIMLDKQQKYDEAARLYKQLVQAAMRGENIPGSLQKIQQRLTFIGSNRP